MPAHEHHDHAPGHAHGHTHGNAHNHGPANYDRAFAIGIALNIGFVVIEAAYGIAANSLALLADAGHNLGDVLGLVMAWGAATLVRRRPTARYTYGLKRSSILVSLANAGLLLLAVGAMPAARSDARHVAVEFVHPVIVGKRALPAIALCGDGGDLAAQAELLTRGDDIAIAFEADSGGDADAREAARCAVARLREGNAAPAGV